MKQLVFPIFPILDQWKCTILVRFSVPVRLKEKQNVLKKTMAGDIAVIWTALFL